MAEKTEASIAPLVSVVLPTYNRGDFVKEAIQSVLAQTWIDFELIVVDDGSTDHTAEVLQEFSSLVSLRLENNSGVSRARNFGIAQARGRYICFLDSDDLWTSKKLETQVRWMEARPDCQVCYTDEVWIRRGVRVNAMDKHRKYSGDIFERCLPLCIVSPSSVLMRLEMLEKIGGFDETMEVCEDYDLWLRMALEHAFDFIEEKLIVKRGGHDDQLSRRHWGMDRHRVYALDKILANPKLSGVRRDRAIETLRHKCQVLIKGYVKRGKTEDARYYQLLMDKHMPSLKCEGGGR